MASRELRDDASFLLARANALSLAAGNEALAAVGLRARSYSVLRLAAGEEHPSQRALAEFLRLDPSQVVALVDDLEHRGLVERSADPADRRANVVTATTQGRALANAAGAAAAAAERHVLRALDSAECEHLTRLLGRVAFPD